MLYMPGFALRTKCVSETSRHRSAPAAMRKCFPEGTLD